ncbi:unnamed protein product [Nyctereutes procyonoides]|uniref:(raccoon dog) hypothetical protein n=1 Tax=Nyctereutes procyonoides TaxID=34880 RepID=A0A811ZEY4_NYCPR|nr:unnamed protein product [Nyctereutes procyonoides]
MMKRSSKTGYSCLCLDLREKKLSVSQLLSVVFAVGFL